MLDVKPITDKEKKKVLKCLKQRDEDASKIKEIMERIVVDPEKKEYKTNGEMNDKYKKALENARNEINNIIGNCKSGMYKDINKLIGLIMLS